MSRCPRMPNKKRVGKPHRKQGGGGSKGDYKNSMKGHPWMVGEDGIRVCAKCGLRPVTQRVALLVSDPKKP